MSNQTNSEKAVLLKASEGDAMAFAQLFYAYKGKLFSFVFDLTDSEEKAEDIVQEVFLRIWQGRGKLNEVDNFNAYIFRAARNQAIDLLRKLSRETLLNQELSRRSIHGSVSGPDESLLYKQMQQRIAEAVDRLPPKQKQVYLLHKEAGLHHDEIARKMDLSVSTVQNHMFRAIGHIRAYLNRYYPEAPFCLIPILGASVVIL